MNTATEQRYLARVGEAIHKLRVEKLGARSKQELGRQANISGTMVGLIERGETNPSILTLVAIAKALDVELSELLP